MAEDLEMSKQEFALAYNGESRKLNHTMDVEALAPAMLSLGKLVREANAKSNGRKATAKVLVSSDFEHKCFYISFELIVSYLDQVKTFFGDENVDTAKDILEWLGLLGVTGGGGYFTYFQYMKFKKGRKIQEVLETSDSDKSGTVQVKIEGEKNHVTITNNVYNLSIDSKALRHTRDAFTPVGQDGIDTVQIHKPDGSLIGSFKSDEIEEIIASCNTGIDEANENEPEIEETTAWLQVYSPVYEASADRWRFKLGKEVIYADISETKIAEDALERGVTSTDDSYQVKLEITTIFDAKGRPKKPTYKVINVLKFIPGQPSPEQLNMLTQVINPHISGQNTDDGEDE